MPTSTCCRGVLGTDHFQQALDFEVGGVIRNGATGRKDQPLARLFAAFAPELRVVAAPLDTTRDGFGVPVKRVLCIFIGRIPLCVLRRNTWLC